MERTIGRYSTYSLIKPQNYIEIPIPSFSSEIPNEPDMIARRQW